METERKYRIYMSMRMWLPFCEEHTEAPHKCADHILGTKKTWWTERFAFEQIKAHLKAVRIQAAWRRAVSNPEYKVCRRRLLREFNSESF